jgi:hypothetical protein
MLTPTKRKPLTLADIAARILALAPEQQAQPALWYGEERGGAIYSIHVLADDYINPSGDGWEPVSFYAQRRDEHPDVDLTDIVARKGDVFLVTDLGDVPLDSDAANLMSSSEDPSTPRRCPACGHAWMEARSIAPTDPSPHDGVTPPGCKCAQCGKAWMEAALSPSTPPPRNGALDELIIDD